MGTHDMGWAERAIFGKIRFMNYAGCKRKFDIKQYAETWAKGAKGATGSKSPAASAGGGGKKKKQRTS
jgi:deoxyribodipyrimidine photo-lyase